jgi:AraC family transcriptional regulator
MIWAEHFLETNNHLSININHCNWGSFEELLHSQDQTPHNRLYFISSDSPCANSYICNHADNSKRYSLEAGTIFFIPGHYDLEYAFYPELVFTAIHFRLELFTGFDIFSDQDEILALPDSDSSGEHILQILQSSDSSGEHILQILQSSDSLGRTARLKGLFLDSTGRFINHNSQTVISMMKLKERYGKLFDWIRQNIRAGITIAEISDAVGNSAETLSRNFSKDTGTTLKHYLNGQLSGIAAERLLASNRAIYEIAHDLSFNDEYYFSRFFKRQTGLSPADYRKRYQTAPGGGSAVG